MSKILYGAAVADALNEKTISEITKLSEFGIKPFVRIIRVGNKKDDDSYLYSIKKNFNLVGIDFDVTNYPDNVSTEELINYIHECNDNEMIHGVLLLRPVPLHIDLKKLSTALVLEKDIDGLCNGQVPCSTIAVFELLKYYDISLKNKKACVIGNGELVGKPVARYLQMMGTLVNVCDVSTQNTKEIAMSSDIIVCACGKAKLVDEEYIDQEKDQIIIDLGIDYLDGKLCGDAAFDKIADKVAAITPVPGGVGSITTSVLSQKLVMLISQGLKKGQKSLHFQGKW